MLSTLNAAAFNAVGDFSTKQRWLDCSPEKLALHAMVGGLLNEAAGGDFISGALAAGANEALVRELAVLVNNESNLLLMSLQLVALLRRRSATATSSRVRPSQKMPPTITTCCTTRWWRCSTIKTGVRRDHAEAMYENEMLRWMSN